MKAAALSAPPAAQVNLLPGDVREARQLSVVKRWLFASAGVTVLAVGTVAGVAHLQTRAASSELSLADAETTQLIAQQAPYTEVTTVHEQVDVLREARAYAFGTDVLWGDYLQAVVAVTPRGVGISNIDYRGATPVTPAPASTDPLVGTGVGTVTFTALARGVPDTAAWADALDGVPGISDARVDLVALTDGRATDFPYEVTGTFQVSAAALSHRFETEHSTQHEGDS